MEATGVISENFLERRRSSSNQRTLWNSLSISQKLQAKKLLKFGYELTFLHKDTTDKMAILLYGESIVTVNDSGDIINFSEIMIEEVELFECYRFSNRN